MGRSQVIGYGNPAGIDFRSNDLPDSDKHAIDLQTLEILDTEYHPINESSNNESALDSNAVHSAAYLVGKAREYVFPSEVHVDCPSYCNPAYRMPSSPMWNKTEVKNSTLSSSLSAIESQSTALSRGAPDGRGTGFATGLSPHTALWDSKGACLSSDTSYRVQYTEPVHPFLSRG